MADDEQAAGERAQLVDQPALGRQVEMVGGLVEHHRVGRLEQHPHEVDASALASRQRGHVLEEQRLWQAEAVGQAGDLALHLVAAGGPGSLLEAVNVVDAPPRWATRPWPPGPCGAGRRARRAPGPTARGTSALASTPSPPGTGTWGRNPTVPSTRTSPEAWTMTGGVAEDERISDDLPAPLRPTRPTLSVLPTTKEASRTSILSPTPIVTSLAVIIGSIGSRVGRHERAPHLSRGCSDHPASSES